ncbi:MAG: TAXI family TRAP transporter solute-binding subunit [Micropepsaceae bacterium]
MTLTRRTLMLSAAALALVSARAQDRRRLVVVTGGTGGVFYPYGGGLAKVLSEKMPNTQATAQVTGGSVDNVKLLSEGEADIGFSTLDSAYDGYTGGGAYAADGPQNIRLIARLYDSFLHVVTTEGSGITSIAGLKGKRVSVGSAGSSTESIADRVIAAAGLNHMTDITRDNLSVSESAGALADGKIDAFFWIGGLPTTAVKDLAAAGQLKLRFIDTAIEVAVLKTRFPEVYADMTMPAGVYAGQDADVRGLGVANVLIVAGDAADALVTDILTAIFDNLEAVHAIHPEAANLAIAGAYVRTNTPWHPAAEAFYAARGVTLP